MNEIVQHIPGFVDRDEGDTKVCANFNSLGQLLEVPFVKSWVKDPNFHQFSFSGGCLIAELRGGRSWWVVGYLHDPVPGLPEWDHGTYEVFDLSGEPLEVPGREVLSSCGDSVTLRDGRVLKSRKG